MSVLSAVAQRELLIDDENTACFENGVRLSERFQDFWVAHSHTHSLDYDAVLCPLRLHITSHRVGSMRAFIRATSEVSSAKLMSGSRATKIMFFILSSAMNRTSFSRAISIIEEAGSQSDTLNWRRFWHQTPGSPVPAKARGRQSFFVKLHESYHSPQTLAPTGPDFKSCLNPPDHVHLQGG